MEIFLIVKLSPHVIEHGASSDGITKDIGTEVLHFILTSTVSRSSEYFGKFRIKDFNNDSERREILGLAPDTYESFLDCLRKDYSQETVPEILAPLLYKNTFDISVDMSIDSLAKMVSETLKFLHHLLCS
jgi:hypothetical protein